MQTITDFVKFLKSRQSFQDRNELKYATSNPHAAAKHKQTSLKYAAVIDWLKRHGDNPLSPQPNNTDDELFSLNPLDMKDIPDDRIEIALDQIYVSLAPDSGQDSGIGAWPANAIFFQLLD